VVLAADAFSEGHALSREFAKLGPTILNGAKELYDHIRCCRDTSKLYGYLIHSHHFPTSAATRVFWQLQASIILELCKIRHLSILLLWCTPSMMDELLDFLPRQSVVAVGFCQIPWYIIRILETLLLSPVASSSASTTKSTLPIQHVTFLPHLQLPLLLSHSTSGLRLTNWNTSSLTLLQARNSMMLTHSCACLNLDQDHLYILLAQFQSLVHYCLHTDGADSTIQYGSEVQSVTISAHHSTQ
jgi:hypothetical protein